MILAADNVAGPGMRNGKSRLRGRRLFIVQFNSTSGSFQLWPFFLMLPGGDAVVVGDTSRERLRL